MKGWRRNLSGAQLRAVDEAKRLEREARREERKTLKAERRERDAAVLKSAAPNHRQPRERDNAFLAYIRRAPCLCCLIQGALQTGPAQAAHVRSSYPEPGWAHTGKAQKPSDFRCLPLDSWCHLDGPHAQHKGSERDFWSRLGVYPPAACAAFKAGFTDNQDPAEIARRIAIEARMRGAA